VNPFNRRKVRARLQREYEEILDHAEYLRWAIAKLDEESLVSLSSSQVRCSRHPHKKGRRALSGDEIMPEGLRED
jgi:hypothetical protein